MNQEEVAGFWYRWRIVLLLGRSDLILLQFMRSWRRAWSASRACASSHYWSRERSGCPVRSAGKVGRGEDLLASDPGACWLAAHSKTAAVLHLIMLQAIQANINTPTAARLSWGARASPNAMARPSNTPGNTCIG